MREVRIATKIHPSADVSNLAEIGDGTSIWHHSQVRENTHLGENCILGKGVYVDSGVTIGDNVKIQNYVSVFHGVTIEDGVFIGPHVCFTNDLRPRAINPDGTLKLANDWEISETLIKHGASIGANSTVLCGVTVGEWAMAGSGSVITKDIPAHGLVVGNPARLIGFVCPCGARLVEKEDNETKVSMLCPKCGLITLIDNENYSKLKHKESRR